MTYYRAIDKKRGTSFVFAYDSSIPNEEMIIRVNCLEEGVIDG